MLAASAGSIVLMVFLLLLGLVLIIKGGDWFVDAAVWIAEVSHIPKFIIGATIVSIATTLPELLVSAMAAGQGKVDMAIGNAVGSVTANVGLIMAITLVVRPAPIERKMISLKSALLTVSIIMLGLLSFTGEMNMWLSLLLFIPFGVFMAENIIEAKKDISEANMKKATDEAVAESEKEKAEQENAKAESIKEKTEKHIWQIALWNVAKFILGTAGIVVGSRLLVDNGSELATLAGVPEGVIAATLIAVGTSLPELVTAITALVKKQSSMSIGNVLGANVIDITLILPICAMISGGALPVPNQALLLDFPFCLGVTLIAVVPMIIFRKYQRWQGILLLTTYVTYMGLLFSGIVA